MRGIKKGLIRDRKLERKKEIPYFVALHSE
jgi:hypothetical protein